jgi:hypothetical protein
LQQYKKQSFPALGSFWEDSETLCRWKRTYPADSVRNFCSTSPRFVALLDRTEHLCIWISAGMGGQVCRVPGGGDISDSVPLISHRFLVSFHLKCNPKIRSAERGICVSAKQGYLGRILYSLYIFGSLLAPGF